MARILIFRLNGITPQSGDIPSSCKRKLAAKKKMEKKSILGVTNYMKQHFNQLPDLKERRDRVEEQMRRARRSLARQAYEARIPLDIQEDFTVSKLQGDVMLVSRDGALHDKVRELLRSDGYGCDIPQRTSEAIGLLKLSKYRMIIADCIRTSRTRLFEYVARYQPSLKIITIVPNHGRARESMARGGYSFLIGRDFDPEQLRTCLVSSLQLQHRVCWLLAHGEPCNRSCVDSYQTADDFDELDMDNSPADVDSYQTANDFGEVDSYQTADDFGEDDDFGELDMDNSPDDEEEIVDDTTNGMEQEVLEPVTHSIPWNPVLRSDSTSGLSVDIHSATSFRMGKMVAFNIQFYATSTITGIGRLRGNYFFDLPYGTAENQRFIGFHGSMEEENSRVSGLLGKNRIRIIIDIDGGTDAATGAYTQAWAGVSGFYLAN